MNELNLSLNREEGATSPFATTSAGIWQKLTKQRITSRQQRSAERREMFALEIKGQEGCRIGFLTLESPPISARRYRARLDLCVCVDY